MATTKIIPASAPAQTATGGRPDEPAETGRTASSTALPRESDSRFERLKRRTRNMPFQAVVSGPFFRKALDAVDDNYHVRNEIAPLKHSKAPERVPARMTGLDKAILGVAPGWTRDVRRIQGAEAVVRSRLSGAFNAQPRRTMLAGVALAAAAEGHDGTLEAILDEIPRIDFTALAGGDQEDVGAAMRTTRSRAIQLILSMARTGPEGQQVAAMILGQTRTPGQDSEPGAELGALARLPLPLEHMPRTTGQIARELLRTSPPGPAAALSRAERQVTAKAIDDACRGDIALALRVVAALPSYDVGAALASSVAGAASSTQPGVPIDVRVAVERTLRAMSRAGGSAALAAVKLIAPLHDGTTMTLADLRVIFAASGELVDVASVNPEDQDLRHALAQARRVRDAVDPARLVDHPTGFGDDCERGEQGNGLGFSWPSPQRLLDHDVAQSDIDRRIPALALTGLASRLTGAHATKPELAAIGAVRNGIVRETGNLEFAEALCTDSLARWLHPGAGNGWLAWLNAHRLGGLGELIGAAGSKFTHDPLARMVKHGPLGSLNNLAVPQFGMKQALPPMLSLTTLVLQRRLHQPDDDAKARDVKALAMRAAVVAAWGERGQAMMGTLVDLGADDLERIGLQAARLAGRQGEEAIAFAHDITSHLKDQALQLDQSTLRGFFDTLLQELQDIERQDAPVPPEIEAELPVLVEHILRATGSPADFDAYYADDRAKVPDPAFGSGASRQGWEAQAARDASRGNMVSQQIRQMGTSSGSNHRAGWGGTTPDPGGLVSGILRGMSYKVFGADWAPTFSGGPVYGRANESVFRIGLNATGGDFIIGTGRTESMSVGAGVGVAVKAAYDIGGLEQRVGSQIDASYGLSTKSSYRQVCFRVPRTSEDEGGVPRAGAGSSFDDLRMQALGRIWDRLGELLKQGEPHPVLALLAEFPYLGVGIADDESGYTDTTRGEVGGRVTLPSPGVGTIPIGEQAIGEAAKAELAKQGRRATPAVGLTGSIGLSAQGSRIADGRRELRYRTYGYIDAERKQVFSQWKSQVGLGAQVFGRPAPSLLQVAIVPQGGNHPTSMALLRTRIDGVYHRPGVYFSMETESKREFQKHLAQHIGHYGEGMVSVRKDLTNSRERQLEKYRQEPGIDEQQVRRRTTELLSEDVRAQMEQIHGTVDARSLAPGDSFRGTGEVQAEPHARANDLIAVLELERAKPVGRDEALIRTLQAELDAVLDTTIDGYTYNDIGVRTNTYDSSEFNVQWLFSGTVSDARTSKWRGKTS